MLMLLKEEEEEKKTTKKKNLIFLYVSYFQIYMRGSPNRSAVFFLWRH